MPGLAGRFELGREGGKRGFAIGDGIDGNVLRWRLFTEVESGRCMSSGRVQRGGRR